MRTVHLLAAVAALALAAEAASAADMTITSWGGAYQTSQRKAFFEPYAQKTGAKITEEEYNGEFAKLRAMVEANDVTWDVVDVDTQTAQQGCDEGILEVIDYAKVGQSPDKFVEGAPMECAVGNMVYSTVFAYDADKLKDGPTKIADLFDTKKFPGKRALQKDPFGNLEFALMADGVPPNQVYEVLSTPEGVDRAFKKLDELKPSIQWWEAGAQPPQYLASGDVVMSSAYNGRIAAVQKESNLKVVWNGGIYDFDAWAIPKGAKDIEEAKKFIAFSVQPEQQKTYSENIAYGPANSKAVSLLSDAVKKDMPTTPENIANQVQIDVAFWADNSEQLEQRFNAWAAKK